MKKYFNKIIHGDCIDVMKKFPDNSVDLIFADPPYYLQLPGKKRLKRPDGSEVIPVEEKWDIFKDYEDYDNFSTEWISESQRILKPSGTIWIIGMYHNIFRIGKIMQDLGLWFLNDVIWVKRGALPNLACRRLTNNHETLIWAAKNKKHKKYTFNYKLLKEINGGKQMKDTDWNFLICRGKERLRKKNGIKAHPTQKPFSLIEQVLLTSSSKNDIILDPFMGSGTTAVAAKSLGRKWIGIEKQKTYINLANKRIKTFKLDK